MTKSPDAFRTISEVAEWLGIQAHVLRFWESKFSQVKPVKRAGGRRYYRPSDMLLLGGIKQLLHEDGLTIKGVQKILREQGVAHVSDLSQPLESTAEEAASGDVLEFKAVADTATAEAEPANAPSSEPAPEPERLEAETGDTTPEPEPEPEITPEDEEPPSPVPTFQHRRLNLSETPSSAPEPDAAAPEPEPEPEEVAAQAPAEPEPVVKPKPRIVDAPDPPLESEITVTPGILAQLARIDRINADQARQIAPVLAELREWMGQNTGTRSS